MVTSSKLIKEQFYQNKEAWKKSFLEGFSQDEKGDAVPWMTYPAIKFFEENLNKNHKIFEFGCGASTLFFTKRVKKVISLETRKNWMDLIQENLEKQQSKNSEIHLMIDGLENQNYENFAKNCDQKFDFIIIDSLKRFECAKNSISALEPGGSIVLDDSERKNYQKIFDFFAEKKFKKTDFLGIAPGQLRIKNTTIFYK